MAQTLESKPAVRKTRSARSESEPLSGKKTQTSGKKSQKTFKRKPLEEAFVHFLQLAFAESKSPEGLSASLKALLHQKIDYHGGEQFDSPTAESDLLGDILLGTGIDPAPAKVAKIPSMPPHLARLCEAKLLSSGEEKSLFQRMNFLKFKAEEFRLKLDPSSQDCWQVRRIEGLLKASEWYRDYIVRSNLRLVISIVKKFVNAQNGFDDLLSDGIVALIRAVDKFDVSQGFRFSTYATQVVRRNTYRCVMEKQTERKRNVGSIHENGVDIGDDQKESSMSEARWHELRSRLSLMLDHLDRREKFIIRARFSLGGHRRIQTLQRLADKLGVSKERVRQLEKRALDKLRGMVSLISLPEIES